MAPSEQQCFCHVGRVQARKTWKGDAILHLPKNSNWRVACGWIWVFCIETSELRALQELKKRKDLRIRH